jgi:hypothetical protein
VAGTPELVRRDAGKKKEMKKGQEFDEGVPRTPDRRSRLELIESASPIAFAEHPHFSYVQSPFQIGTSWAIVVWNGANSLYLQTLKFLSPVKEELPDVAANS